MYEISRLYAKTPVVKRSNSSLRIQRKKSSQQLKSPADQILFLQRTIGNQAVQRLIKSGTLKAKLKISHPGDRYEQEADRVADAVMQMPEPTAASGVSPHIQRACPTCEEDELRRQPIEEEEELQRQPVEEEEEELQAKATSGNVSEVNPNLESHIHSLKGGGQPLSDNDRAFFEPRFGYDFSKVRLHTDAKAADVARGVNARAFTLGKNVVFGDGNFAPETSSGKLLLAHELTHVVQQSAGRFYSVTGGLHSKISPNLIQRYKLRAFPKKKASRMKMSIASAVTNIANCRKIGRIRKGLIMNALKNKTYYYEPQMKSCGWTYPGSLYIEIGRSAFDVNKCCYLSSTLVHEAAHTEFHTEGMARWLECNCISKRCC